MIDHFNIKNFLVFEELKIPQLRRVNLIAGKNNVGKTALLEALRIYFAKGDSTVVNNILSHRGLFENGWDKTYNNLINKNYLNDFLYGKSNIEFNELIFSKRPKVVTSQGIIKLSISGELSNTAYIKLKEQGEDTQFVGELNSNSVSDNPNDATIYIPHNPKFKKMENFWDNIVLTPKEDSVVEILQSTILPELIRFDIGRKGVKVRLKGEEKPVPLKSLGDGLQRVLFLAISLANAQNSYLLIDEIEMGLHHSVIKKLWELILKYATEWNIQVFATTHSEDMIRKLYYATTDEMQSEIQYLRLQHNRRNELEVLTYDYDKLTTMLDLSLEIR